MKSIDEGTDSLCGEEIKKRIGIEYVQDDKWKIGLIQPDGATGKFILVLSAIACYTLYKDAPMEYGKENL